MTIHYSLIYNYSRLYSLDLKMPSLNEVKRVVMEIAVGSIEYVLSSGSVLQARGATPEFSVPESG